MSLTNIDYLYDVKFNSPFDDPNYINSNFLPLIFLNKSKLTQHKCDKYAHQLFINNLTSEEIFQSIITDKKLLIKKISNTCYLTKSLFPYSLPTYCNQYVFWHISTNNDIINDKPLHSEILQMLKTNDLLDINNNMISYLIYTDYKHIEINNTHIITKYQILTRTILKPTLNFNVKKLKKLIVVSRHGAREPTTTFAGLEPFKYMSDKTNKKSNKFEMSANLTDQGILFCKNFGKYLFDTYNSYLNFDINKTQAYSTKCDRTYDSALNVLIGIFGSEQNIKSGNFAPDYYVESITEQTLSDSITEQTIIKDQNDVEISIIENILKTSSDLLTSQITPEETKYYETTKLSIVITDDEVENLSELNYQIKKIFNFDISSTNDYFKLYSTLEVYKFHKQHISDKWTDKLDQRLTKCVEIFYSKLFNKTKSMKIFTKSIKEKIKEIVKNEEINFAYLSTHDTVIYALASDMASDMASVESIALKSDNLYGLNIPHFCANIRYEFYDDEILIYYNDLLLKNIIF